MRVSKDLDMAIDNEIGGTRHGHRQSDWWKQRRLPTTRSVATSSGHNIAVETMWDVGNNVDNNQKQLVDSGINCFRNCSQSCLITTLAAIKSKSTTAVVTSL